MANPSGSRLHLADMVYTLIWGARIGLFAFLAFATTHSALACGICIEKPEKTISDRLLNADTVVIALEDREQPYSFTAVSYLVGAAHDAPIPYLVDSATGKRLDRNPADGVLMLRKGDAWTRAGYANAEWQRTAAQVLEHRALWQYDPKARFTFFEALLHDSDPFLHHLAIDELSRASYDLIRGMAQPIEGAVARQSLTDRTKIPWQSFYILMLGLSDRDEDHALVRERISRVTGFGNTDQLEAWATALVEIDGTEGIKQLVNNWLAAPHRSPQELRAIVAAVTVHAKHGDPSLREPVLSVLATLAQTRSDVVGTVAVAFERIGDFSRAETIRNAVQGVGTNQAQRIEASELFAASSYIYRSQQVGMAKLDPLLEN